MNITERIINWHRERYHGPVNDIALLSEEAKEFWEATEPAHMLQEYCDFKFVWEGVKWRYLSQVHNTQYELVFSSEEFYKVSGWYHHQLGYMGQYISFNTAAIDKAMLLVLEANELKPLEPVDGKIPKGDKYVSPLPKIRALLAKGTFK